MKKKLTKGFFSKRIKSSGQEWFEIIFIFLQNSSGVPRVCAPVCVGIFLCILGFFVFKLLFKE